MVRLVEIGTFQTICVQLEWGVLRGGWGKRKEGMQSVGVEGVGGSRRQKKCDWESRDVGVGGGRDGVGSVGVCVVWRLWKEWKSIWNIHSYTNYLKQTPYPIIFLKKRNIINVKQAAMKMIFCLLIDEWIYWQMNAYDLCHPTFQKYLRRMWLMREYFHYTFHKCRNWLMCLVLLLDNWYPSIYHIHPTIHTSIHPLSYPSTQLSHYHQYFIHPII